MSDITDVFYVKFRINKNSDTLRNFVLSFDPESIARWPNNKADPEKGTPANVTLSAPTFASIIEQFQNSMETYLISTPFLMSFLPQQIDTIADKSIREPIKKIGKMTVEGDFETYEVPVEHFNKLSKRITYLKALRKGAMDIPSMFFTGMISTYDAFLGNLIKQVLPTRTEILSASEKNISFKDLTEAGSIEILRDRILEKEIETVMRKSHADQISYLEEKLSMPLTKNLAIWPEFIEIFERRNLLAHTSGIISNQYLNVCKSHGYDTKSARSGEKLGIPQDYYMRSVEVITEFSIKLSQVVWRKLLPNEINKAASELNNIVFDLLQNSRYKIAENIAKFGLQEMKKNGTDSTRKMLTVNHALALKFGDKSKEVEAALSAEDWSAAGLDFQICIAAVRGDVSTVVRLMRPALSSGVIDKGALRIWPAFREIRNHPDFLKEFQEITGEQPYEVPDAPDTDRTEGEATSQRDEYDEAVTSHEEKPSNAGEFPDMNSD